MYRYLNGNYLVSISGSFNQNRKYEALRFDEDLNADFPDSIDLKITNKCSHGCKFCHESSNINGKSFDLEKTKKILDTLPNNPIEIAIGGGNVLECYDDLLELIKFCSDKNFSTRITLNVLDILNSENTEKIKKIMEIDHDASLGVSIQSLDQIELLIRSMKKTYVYANTIVLHMILGIFPIEELKSLLELPTDYRAIGRRILILGYKQFGRGKNMSINEDVINQWKNTISNYIYSTRARSNKTNLLSTNYKVIGFDNLAIEQLSLKDMLLKPEWENIYLGTDFSHSMYIDAVEETFAPTSRTNYSERVSWDDISLIDYFKHNHNKWS